MPIGLKKHTELCTKWLFNHIIHSNLRNSQLISRHHFLKPIIHPFIDHHQWLHFCLCQLAQLTKNLLTHLCHNFLKSSKKQDCQKISIKAKTFIFYFDEDAIWIPIKKNTEIERFIILSSQSKPLILEEGSSALMIWLFKILVVFPRNFIEWR